MKKTIVLLVLAILLGAGAIAAMSAPAQAQFYEYPPQPLDIYAHPWVGPGTPWVYYNGDWFLNGILYLFFGPQYGWAPYYAYPTIYIVRPAEWYAPRWHAWYAARPQIIVQFNNAYPYWRGHTHSRHYDRSFYEKHHRGQGAGWQGGFKGIKHEPPPKKPAPSKMAPAVKEKPTPAPQVAPPPGPPPAPAKAAPPAALKPVPAAPGAPHHKPEKAPPSAPKEEKGGHGGEK